jgi:alpha-mannosidase
MKLVPHTGNWKENKIARIAEEFIAPAVSIYQGIHGGKLPKSGSFLSSDKSNIVVSAVKHAESNNDIIIRCVETDGVKTESKLDLAFAGTQWNGSFNPFEIKTLRLGKGKIKEVNLLEE